MSKKKKLNSLIQYVHLSKESKAKKKKNAKVTSALPLSDVFLQKVIARYKGP